MREPDGDFSPGRRGVLRVFAGTAGGLVVIHAAGLAGCSGLAPGPEGTVVPLAQVPPGQRVRITHLGQPVELLRTQESVTARSLVCTHFGCIVRWQEREGIYHCPCHEGRYDGSGKVLGGPPTKPLAQFKVVVSGETLIVGEPLPG